MAPALYNPGFSRIVNGMVAIEKTIEITADGRLRLDIRLPKTIPGGKTNVVLVFPSAEDPASKSQAAPYLRESFPAIEELKNEARRKTAERLADPSGDSLQKYCGCLKDLFSEDGVEYQREIRSEWPD
jgi:hypothetical protein